MTGTDKTSPSKDPAELARDWTSLAEQSSRVVQAFAARQGGGQDFSIVDPASVFAAFSAAATRMAADPAQLVKAQMQFWHDSMKLWDYALRRAAGGAWQRGQVHLVQRRQGPRDFSYLAIRRPESRSP